MRRVWLGIILAFLALEASALLALFLLKALRDIEYSPISVTSISDEHRRILEDLLAGRTDYIVHNSILGWAIKSNGFTALYQANSKGIRARREYTMIPPEGTLRIGSFGDSFTHGDGVKNEDTWQEILMSTTRDLEALNFGVGGFGLDQAFLRYQQDGIAYHAHVVLIGFMSENIYRHVNVFRPFYSLGTGAPLAKPRYVIAGDRLVLIPNPMQELSQYRDLVINPRRILPRLGAQDYYFRTHYRAASFDILPSVRLTKILRWLINRRYGIVRHGYYDVESEAFKITARIFDRFISAVLQNRSVPVIVVFPNGADVLRYRKNGTKAYAPLLAHFRSKGYRYIDMMDEFDLYRTIAVNDLFSGHYSPLGNKLVAQNVWRYLTENRLVDPKTLR